MYVQNFDEVHILKELISNALSKKGFKVLEDAVICGESGINHKFDLVAVRGDKKMVIDFASPREDINLSFVSVVSKAVDLKGYDAFVVAPSAARDNLLFTPRKVKAIFYLKRKDVVKEFSKL